MLVWMDGFLELRPIFEPFFTIDFTEDFFIFFSSPFIGLIYPVPPLSGAPSSHNQPYLVQCPTFVLGRDAQEYGWMDFAANSNQN